MSRPILPWRSPLVMRPMIGELVWIRRLPWYDTPVRAEYLATHEFKVMVPHHNPDEAPHQVNVIDQLVHSWKYQYQADEDNTYGI